ncbi:MAG: hypothetical protein AB9907_00180 [Flexilinea sp.]
MTLTNLRKKDTKRISINYIIPLWDCCVPGKQEPAFIGLADLQGPPAAQMARIQDLSPGDN